MLSPRSSCSSSTSRAATSRDRSPTAFTRANTWGSCRCSRRAWRRCRRPSPCMVPASTSFLPTSPPASATPITVSSSPYRVRDAARRRRGRLAPGRRRACVARGADTVGSRWQPSPSCCSCAALQIGAWPDEPALHKPLNARDAGYLRSSVRRAPVCGCKATASGRAVVGIWLRRWWPASRLAGPSRIRTIEACTESPSSFLRRSRSVFAVGRGCVHGSREWRWAQRSEAHCSTRSSVPRGSRPSAPQIAFWMRHGQVIWSYAGIVSPSSSWPVALLGGALAVIALAVVRVARSTVAPTRSGVVLLLAASLAPLRMAIERADASHVAWAVTPAWILISVLAAAFALAAIDRGAGGSVPRERNLACTGAHGGAFGAHGDELGANEPDGCVAEHRSPVRRGIAHQRPPDPRCHASRDRGRDGGRGALRCLLLHAHQRRHVVLPDAQAVLLALLPGDQCAADRRATRGGGLAAGESAVTRPVRKRRLVEHSWTASRCSTPARWSRATSFRTTCRTRSWATTGSGGVPASLRAFRASAWARSSTRRARRVRRGMRTSHGSIGEEQPPLPAALFVTDGDDNVPVWAGRPNRSEWVVGPLVRDDSDRGAREGKASPARVGVRR